MNIFQVFLAWIKDKILEFMSYNFQILKKFPRSCKKLKMK